MPSFKENLLSGLQQAYKAKSTPEAQTAAPQNSPIDLRAQIMQQIEEQQRGIDSTYQANISQWREEKAAADRWPVFGVGRMGVPLSRVDTRPDGQKQLAAAAAELKRARKEAETYTKSEQKKDEEKGQERSWLSQLWDGATNLSPDKAVDILTGGMASTFIDSRINPILEKKAQGEELTDTELAVVQARGATQDAQRYVAEQGGATTAYSIGGSLPGTAQFMVETAATGGSLGVGKAIVGGGAKAIGRALGGAAVKEAVRTPLRGSMWQDFEERTGDQYFVQEDGTVDKEESSATARLYKSYMSTFSEGFTEQLGNVAGSGLLAKGAGKIAPKLLGKKMGGALVNGAERLAKATEGVRDVFKKTTNYNGTIDEFGEEIVNNIIEPILTGEPERIRENFSSENMLVTLGSVALVGSVMHSAELPSIVRHELQGGKLRRQTNGAVAAIEDQTLRQGVFDALKKGQTVEQKATQLASLDWGNVSQTDAAHVVDAFSSNLRHELFKGVDQEQTAKEQYAYQYAIFNAEYQKVAHRETGVVQELLDDEGGTHYLLSGSLDDASADNTVFVLDAQTGETRQLDRNRIEHVIPPLTYGELLDKFNAQNIEPQATELDDVDAEAAEARVSPVGYAQGETVDLADGRTGDFIGYMPDGITAQVAIEDELTGEPNTIEVHKGQIVGLSEVAEVSAAVAEPIVEQEAPPVVQEPAVPLQKDGTPDYEAMSAGQFLEHYGNEYSREEALAELTEARGLLEKQLASIGKSNSANLNTRAKNKVKAMAIQRRIGDITSVIGEKAAPIAVAQAPSAEATIEPSQRDQVFGFGDPASLRDYVLRDIVQGKRFRWKDEGASRGLASALGFVGKEVERRVRIGLLKKDGDTPERYAEHLTAEVAPQFGITDYHEVRDEVVDILRSVNSKGQAFAQLEALRSNRPEQIEAEYAAYLQEQAEKEELDASVELSAYLSQVTEAEFLENEAMFAEELLPLDHDGNNKQLLQQPVARPTETGAEERNFVGNGDSRAQRDYGEGGVATDDRGGKVQSGAIGSVGSGRGGNATESDQQSSRIDPSEVRFSELPDDYTAEMERIKSDALERGDFMRAPNGQPTHLTEDQWLQVRTEPFKKWFGDWERAARIEKLRVAEPIAITGKEITPSDDLKQYKRNALEFGKSLRGEYVNADTGVKIALHRGAVKEVLNHDYKDFEHLQSIAAIPQIIEQAIYITTASNEDVLTNPDVDSYDYYVCGLNVGDVNYTVRAVVATKSDGKRYYDHKLSAIEKGKLIEKLAPYSASAPSGLSSTVGLEESTPFRPADKSGKVSEISPTFEYKDKRLLSILQVDASKIVDENGEPLVVYHGTDSEFYKFKHSKTRYGEGSFFFAQNEEDAASYSGDGNTLSVFINLRRPADFEHLPDANLDKLDGKREIVKALIKLGYDGWASEMETGWGEVSAFHPNQIKSATDNTGEFNAQSDDIRFKSDVVDQAFAEMERQQQYEADKLSKKQSSAERRVAIDQALQKLTQQFGVETVQVDTIADLPAPLRAASKDRRFSGLYHKPTGAVYLIGSELRDADHATATYLHEVVAHKGVDGLLGQERAAQFYAAVFDALKPKEQVRLLDQYGDKSVAGDEVVARMAEGDVTPGTMQRIIAAVRRFFREVLGVPLTISDTDIRYILFKSKVSLQRTANLTDAMKAIEADQRMRAVVALDELRAKERRSPIEKLRSADPVRITGNEIASSDDLKQYRRNALEYGKTIRGIYSNKDTGQNIRVSRESITEVLSHSIAEMGHIASVAAIPAVIENATYITTLPNEKQRSEVVSYDYYACGLNVGGVDYTVKMVVANTGLGDKYYDHKLTEIEKGRLVDLIQMAQEKGELTPVSPVIHKSGSGINPPLSEVKDTRLISILQNNLLEDVEQNDIRYSEVEPLRQPIPYRAAGKKGSWKSKAIQFQEAMQDATIKVHLLQNEVKQGGGVIDSFTNAYEALNHVDSRADAAMRKYKRHYMEPITKWIRKWRTEYDVEYDDVTDYLLAKHSLERHASGTSALDEKEDGLWTKEHATKLVDQFEGTIPALELSEFWVHWRTATNEVLECAVRSGRMGINEKRGILGNDWKFYVPLRGKDFGFERVADMRDVYHYDMNRGGGGSSVNKRIADVKAEGRSSKSSDPISVLQHMASTEIYLSEQNNANRTLLRLVEANPERTDLFTVRQQWQVKSPEGLWAETDQTPDAETIRQSAVARKALRTEKDPARRAELQEQITVSLRERDASKVYTGEPQGSKNVSVMKDGIRYTIELVDPEVAAAINYKAGDVQRWTSKYIGTPTRIMAQLSTSKNPAFILPNFVRDMEQAALYNLVDSDGNILGFTRHAFGSWKILDRNLRGVDQPLTVGEIGSLDVTNEADRAELVAQYGKDRVNDTLYDLFVANGGETGYVHIADPKDYQRKLEKDIQTAAGGKWPRKTWKATNAGIDYLAAMSENSVRYATFISQVERGKSVFDSVSYAKNITVNFNRKGKYTKGIGALFMFFNASVQAVVNKYSLWGNKKGKTKKQMRAQRTRFIASQAAMAALGYWSAAMVVELLGSLVGDDGEEYAVSDYERRTNFIIPMPGTEKGYLKIPVSVSERPFYALGVMVCDWVNGKLESSEVLGEFVQVAADSFVPLPVDYSIDKDNAWSWGKGLVPSVIKPLAEIGYNENFAGLPINRTSFNANTPDSKLGLKSASSLSKTLSKWLNELGGGNEITPAGMRADGTKDARNILDLSPSTLDHLAAQYTGGIGRIITETITTLNPDTREARKIPIVNRFYGEAYDKKPSKEYYDLKRRIEFVDKNNRDSKALGIESSLFGPEELEQKTTEYRRLRNRLRATERRIRASKEELEELTTGSEAYEAREAEIQQLQREFIKEYNAQDND